MADEETVGAKPPWEENFVKQMVELRIVKMTQTELARQLTARGLPFHQQTVQRVEKGERPLRLNEALAIAEILGSDPLDMVRPRTTEEHDLQHRIGEVRWSAGQVVEQGLKWKGVWDRERHRLEATVNDIAARPSKDEHVQLTVEHARRLLDQAEQANELVLAAFNKLAEFVTGQETSLIRSKVFDSGTRKDYIVEKVPWAEEGLGDMLGIDWTRREEDTDVEDDVEFD